MDCNCGHKMSKHKYKKCNCGAKVKHTCLTCNLGCLSCGLGRIAKGEGKDVQRAFK